MKNRKLSKICLLTIALAMLITAIVGISVNAEDAPEAPEIVSKNASYEGALHLYYAIPVTDAVTVDNTVVKVYKTNPDTDAYAELIGTYSGKEEYIEMLGGNFIVVRTGGVPAKNIADYAYAQPVSGGVAGKVVRYSVAEYLYERLYVADNATDVQKKLYNSTLQYGIDAQAALAPEATPITDYNYVYAKDATLDAEGNVSGLYLDGATLTLTYTGTDNLASWNLRTLNGEGNFDASTSASNTVTVSATTLISPKLYEKIEMDNSGETFDMAFKDTARENISIPDTGKTYYNAGIYAEKASSNVNAIMYFGVVTDPTNAANKVLRLTKDYGETATSFQSYLTFNAPSTTNFDTVVFESDIYNDFSDKSTSSVTQYDFRNGSTEGVTVLLGSDNGTLSVRVLGTGDVTTSYEAVPGVLADSNWYTLRIEYEIIDAVAGTTETRVYINGNLVKQVNYVNTETPLTNVTNMFVRTYGEVMGDLYMDNVTIKKVYAADEERPAYTYDGTTVPEGVTVGGWGGTAGTVTVNNGQLTLNSSQGRNDSFTFYETEAAEENANTVVWSADIRSEALAAFANGSYSELSFSGTEGGNFRFNIMLRNKIGESIYFKSYGRNPKLELTDTGVNSGDLYNLRLEYYVAEGGTGRVDIYINNNLIGTMDDSTEGKPTVDAVNRFALNCRDGDTQFITLDNVRLYKINKDR